jgi:hypothetical protein
MKKRITSVFLIFVFCISINLTAFANENSLEPILDNGTSSITLQGVDGNLVQYDIDTAEYSETDVPFFQLKKVQ